MPPYWDKIKASKTVKQNTFSSLIRCLSYSHSRTKLPDPVGMDFESNHCGSCMCVENGQCMVLERKSSFPIGESTGNASENVYQHPVILCLPFDAIIWS